MKDSIIAQCLEILKREDIKKECKQLFAPVVELILYEISHYIYISLAVIFIIFIMILAILIILILILRNKSLINKVL